MTAVRLFVTGFQQLSALVTRLSPPVRYHHVFDQHIVLFLYICTTRTTQIDGSYLFLMNSAL